MILKNIRFVPWVIGYVVCIDLSLGETGVKGDPLPVSSEEDIFEYLGMQWKEPHERNI